MDLLGCCLVYLHFPWGILHTGTVIEVTEFTFEINHNPAVTSTIIGIFEALDAVP